MRSRTLWRLRDPTLHYFALCRPARVSLCLSVSLSLCVSMESPGMMELELEEGFQKEPKLTEMKAMES
ncbi:hypothetical protein Q7C36_008361 [Tachysurus vachellii]|uniref:Uncharacterized protein n=1 Tax=Tachysurus vachellii TaxID=175792 RepID=A0AA88NGJ7_TACVA|nr:hypothetical protein Q7C36_008361 [Tachysurus vachellii]